MRSSVKIGKGKFLGYAVGLILVVLLSIFIWFINQPSIVPDVSRESPESPETRTALGKKRSPAPEAPSGTLPLEASTGLVIGPQRLQSIAQHTSLQLLDPKSLAISRATLDLLGLNPTQVEELNEALKGFLTSLKSAEVAHAYVTINDEGGEEIVVGPFDRSKLIDKFRSEVVAKLGKDVGEFVGEQVVYDRSANVSKSEMRLFIERGADGIDNVVFSQDVVRRDASDFSPTFKMRIKTPLCGAFGPRYGHLFSAVDRLPHR